MGVSNLFTKQSEANASYYAKIVDIKPQGTKGGSFVKDAYRTRDLNTIEKNENGIITSLSGNRFTLQKGTYEIEAYAPGAYVYTHKARLYNVTDAVTEILGTTAYHFSYSVNIYSMILGKFTIIDSKEFEIQHKTAVTINTHGFGYSYNYFEETYTIVILRKVA